MLVLENNPIDDDTTGPMDTITQKQSGKRKVKVKKKSAVVSTLLLCSQFVSASFLSAERKLPFFRTLYLNTKYQNLDK